jgi:cation transport ATPase
MERFVQWLDDLEDIVFAVVLSGEAIRRILKSLFYAGLVLILQAAGILLALTHPPTAVAGGSLMLVAILYRGAVYRDIGQRRQSLTA